MGDTTESRTRCLVPFADEGSLADMKRAALLFDEIIPAFCTSIPRARRARFPLIRAFIPHEDALARVTAELDWLYDKGLLHAPAEDPFPTGFEFEGFEPRKPLWIVRVPGATVATQQVGADFTVTDVLEVPLFTEFGPVFLTRNRRGSSDSQAHNRQVVAEIILRHLPEPADNTPWEAILDWRTDTDAQAKLRRLRHWMNSVAQRSDVDPVLLSDEISHLADDYQQAMAVHAFQVQAGALRTIVTTTAAVLENLAKLRLEKLADLPFQIAGRRIKRAEADLRAPGRELAYIVDARARFR